MLKNAILAHGLAVAGELVHVILRAKISKRMSKISQKSQTLKLRPGIEL